MHTQATVIVVNSALSTSTANAAASALVSGLVAQGVKELVVFGALHFVPGDRDATLFVHSAGVELPELADSCHSFDASTPIQDEFMGAVMHFCRASGLSVAMVTTPGNTFSTAAYDVSTEVHACARACERVLLLLALLSARRCARAMQHCALLACIIAR
jgi:hypothetical protein